MLLDISIELDVKFGGVVKDLPADLDFGSRSELLRIIDSAKKNHQILQCHRDELKARLHFNIHNIRICAFNNTEDLLLRIPLCQIAAVSYIQDVDLHLVLIIFGETDLQRGICTTIDAIRYHIALVYSSSRQQAEEFCNKIEECFQLIYTEASMHFFDLSLMEGESAIQSSSNPGLSLIRNFLSKKEESSSNFPAFLSNSTVSLGLKSGQIEEEKPAKNFLNDKQQDLTEEANKLILDYMDMLYTKLTSSELQEFSVLVKSWHTTDLSFPDFCQKVSQLYGPERSHLLVGMRPFIPSQHVAYFEKFLETRCSNIITADNRRSLDNFDNV